MYNHNTSLRILKILHSKHHRLHVHELGSFYLLSSSSHNITTALILSSHSHNFVTQFKCNFALRMLTIFATLTTARAFVIQSFNQHPSYKSIKANQRYDDIFP